MGAVKVGTKKGVQGIKPVWEIHNGKKVPVYKIPTGMSGINTKPHKEIEDDEEDSYDSKSSIEERMSYELQKFYDNGKSDDPYIEENFGDILTLDVDEDLFDQY